MSQRRGLAIGLAKVHYIAVLPVPEKEA